MALLADWTTRSPSFWCQAAFLSLTTSLLVLPLLPPDLRRALTAYGARAPMTQQGSGRLARWARLAQVPHSWFWHFYAVSFAWWAWWAWQFLRRRAVMEELARAQMGRAEGKGAGGGEGAVELGGVVLGWAMMVVQGGRRLYECRRIDRPGSKSMLLPHWAVGLTFYTLMNVAIWIDGSRAIVESWSSPSLLLPFANRKVVALCLFLAASFEQHRCHRHLASLKKYTLPQERISQYIVCPRYTCECVIYLSLSVVTAPAGSLCNKTVLCGLAFVLVNLGITAQGTASWYVEKFGAERVRRRWKMIPGGF